MSDDGRWHIAIEQRDDHAAITAIRPCTVSWSNDGTIWRYLPEGDGRMAVGEVIWDYESPASRPRSYHARIDGEVAGQEFLAPALGAAFADAMRSWLPLEDFGLDGFDV